MKKRFLPFLALLALAPIASHAACATSDFALQDVKAGMVAGHVSVAGKLVNNCVAAAGAELQVDGKDAAGNILQTKRGWAAGTSNLDPSQSVSFDLGRLMHPQPGMDTYTVRVVDTRIW